MELYSIASSLQSEYISYQAMAAKIVDQAAIHPSNSAVVSNSKTLSYHHLVTRSISLANMLHHAGCANNSMVAVYMDRSPELIIALLGTMLAGGTYVVIDPAYPENRAAFMFNDADPVAIVTQTHLAARIQAHNSYVIDIANVPDMAQLQEFSQNRWPSDAAYMIYTSGSTGQPKGVLVSDASIHAFVHWYSTAFQISSGDRIAQLVSPSFDVLGLEIWPALVQGATLCIPDELTKANAQLLRDWIIEEEITVLATTATLAEQLMQLPWPDATKLRLLHSGGDVLHSFSPKHLPFHVINNYGPTEATIEALFGIVPTIAEATTKLPTLGKPVPFASIYLLDENLRPVSLGDTGEIVIGGAGVAIGYHNRPELTAERFIADPFTELRDARMYRTGDLAYQLPNGEYVFAGRKDDQIKLRGYRIELGEIEHALISQSGIRQCAVTVISPNSADAQLAAYIVPDANGDNLSPSSLQAVLQHLLPDYMIPTVFAQIEQIPLTPNGKINRAALPEMTAENMMPDAAQQEECTYVEAQLIKVIAPLVHRETVSLDDNFFLLGGHSLLGTQVITRIRSTFGVSLSLRALFDAPTIRALANEIETLILQQMEMTQ